jgi:hypothetical protein
MVTHIVFFSFKNENKQANMVEVKKRIESMMGKIAPLKEMEVGFDFSAKERAMDMALVTRFDDKEELGIYATHPVHLEVIEYIKTVVEYTKVVDYES